MPWRIAWEFRAGPFSPLRGGLLDRAVQSGDESRMDTAELLRGHIRLTLLSACDCPFPVSLEANWSAKARPSDHGGPERTFACICASRHGSTRSCFTLQPSGCGGGDGDGGLRRRRTADAAQNLARSPSRGAARDREFRRHRNRSGTPMLANGSRRFAGPEPAPKIAPRPSSASAAPPSGPVAPGRLSKAPPACSPLAAAPDALFCYACN